MTYAEAIVKTEVKGIESPKPKTPQDTLLWFEERGRAYKPGGRIWLKWEAKRLGRNRKWQEETDAKERKWQKAFRRKWFWDQLLWGMSPSILIALGFLIYGLVTGSLKGV